ncbi:hypothetical protein Tfer_2835 [Thermincola ferriacetica]|uniref:Uncharacterized protein n=2 Tax=Thermincola TaxID=278993 RepID=D5XA77_THEPJ|nr:MULTISPECIES: hypothetical protein [Thermincola]ADG83210.1 hypothetical protein TherJR_2370 [Thermincola potens JR]KNZ68583.1 hypothetical protein Tfer_2835 [Thermincola ferriacetica]
MLWKRPIHPTVITVVSLPAFLLGGLLAGINWINLGQRERGINTMKYSLLGTVFILLVILSIPRDVALKFWSVGVGINLGVGMALRKLQLPAYEAWKFR